MLFEVEHTLLHDFSFLTGLAFFELLGIGEVGILVYKITYCMFDKLHDIEIFNLWLSFSYRRLF